MGEHPRHREINIQSFIRCCQISWRSNKRTRKTSPYQSINSLDLLIKASKAELNSGLSMKANISDVSRTVAEVATNIESRVSLDDLQSFLDEKVARSDLQVPH